jgi:hypothetical protein
MIHGLTFEYPAPAPASAVAPAPTGTLFVVAQFTSDVRLERPYYGPNGNLSGPATAATFYVRVTWRNYDSDTGPLTWTYEPLPMFGHYPEFHALLTTSAFQLAVAREFHKRRSILDEKHEVQLSCLDRSSSFAGNYYVEGSHLHTHHQNRYRALHGSLNAIRTPSNSA